MDVVLQDIKNVHLSVCPSTARVPISAPERMSLDTVRIFAISKMGRIRQQRRKLLEQERKTPREYFDRESHYFWGKRHLLKVMEERGSVEVELTHRKLILPVGPGTDQEARQSIVDRWYTEQVKATVPELIAKWEPIVGVEVEHFFLQGMKTKWGSWNSTAQSIRLNTDLAKKPRECLEYILVHEKIHILESTHNARFAALMDQRMPRWQSRRERLNRFPLRHVKWAY